MMRAPGQLQNPMERVERIAHAMEELSRVLKECNISDTGGVRGSTVYDGTQWSGVGDVRGPSGAGTGSRDGIPTQILNCRRMGSTPLGGMASVHVQVTDTEAIESGNTPNARIVMDVAWQSGRGGGEAQVDIQRGSVFTVGGADTITASARIIPAHDGTFYPPETHKRVEASVCWGGGINPKNALGTSEGVTLGAGGVSARLPIPRQAESLMVVTDDPAGYGTLEVAFFRGAAGARGFAALNPFSNTVPIVSGAEYIVITTVNACIAYPIWFLHL